MADKFIWYNRKVAGPFKDFPTKGQVDQWKFMVNSGTLKEFPDTPPMNEDMINHPWDAHIICEKEDLK